MGIIFTPIIKKGVKMKEERLLRKPTVLDITGLSTSTLYHFMREGTFPQSVKLGKRTVAWKQSEVNRWINSRKISK